MKAECFPGIRTEQLYRVLDNKNLGTPDTVIIHVGTNDLRKAIDKSGLCDGSGVLAYE
jgi:hypothetical protein